MKIESCSKESVLFRENGFLENKVCGKQTTNLAYETCSNKLEIIFTTTTSGRVSSPTGLLMYYEGNLNYLVFYQKIF